MYTITFAVVCYNIYTDYLSFLKRGRPQIRLGSFVVCKFKCNMVNTISFSYYGVMHHAEKGSSGLCR